MNQQDASEPDAQPVEEQAEIKERAEETERAAQQEGEEPSLLSSPVIRATIAVVALALIVIAVGFVLYTIASNARRQPIDIDLYPGAILAGQLEVAPGHDRMLYTTGDDAETVVAFYRERYNRGDDQRCIRVENASMDPDLPAFEERCVIDNSIVNAHQSATVTIQPHASGEYAGFTVIFIERFWQE